MPKKTSQNTSKAALAYLLWFITGIYFLITESKDSFVRFHAMQSTVTFGALFVLNFVPVLGFFTFPVGIILWIFLMYKAYSGERYKLSYIGQFADQLLGK